MRGERSASDLEALRVAGLGVYQALSDAEQARVQMLATGQDLWSAPRAVGGHLLATWNAYVLQTLGGGVLDADYAADSGTVGYVPPVTFDQVWSWFSAASGWLSLAQQIYANPDYDLAATLRLPAALPAWPRAECPPAYVRALLTAVPPIREHAEFALFDLEKQAHTDDQRHAVNRLHQYAADAAAAADYAQALAGSPGGLRLNDLIEAHVKRAITLWFHLGQLAAMPTLLGRYRPKAGPIRIDPDTLPGGIRFDPWVLTSAGTRAQWQADPRAQAAIAAMWAADADPARTLTIHAEIEAALAAGAIQHVDGTRMISYYFSCPWSPIYQVRRPVTIDGRRLSVPQQFTFDVSSDHIPWGGSSFRRILLGPFTPTGSVGYGS
jgi:hypothetical protein